MSCKGLVVSLLVALAFTLAVPVAFASSNPWKPVAGYPHKWTKELGETPGETRLSVEYRCGQPPHYTRMNQCADPKKYSVVGWKKGQSQAPERTCTGTWVPFTHLSSLERRGGELPKELTELPTECPRRGKKQ